MDTLHNALKTYQQALLDTAAGDLILRQAGLPLPEPKAAAAAAASARHAVLAAAKNVTAEQFTGELMAAGFCQAVTA